MTRWSFTRDPVAFLGDAGDLLATDPLVATVVASNATHHAAAAAEPGWVPPETLRWFAVLRDARGKVAGAAMRTHPSPPHPPFLLPCGPEDAEALARALHERGEEVSAVNGAQPAVGAFAAESVRLAGGTVRLQMATRIFEAATVLIPPAPPGRMRRATPEDRDVCAAWLDVFDDDADAQAGRPAGAGTGHVDSSFVDGRIERGEIWVWERPDGEIVHQTALNRPAYGMSRVAIVYTAAEHRGHGYAARVVAELAAARLAEGSRVCLFADRDNPVSTGVYERIGFRPVVDTADLLLVRAP